MTLTKKLNCSVTWKTVSVMEKRKARQRSALLKLQEEQFARTDNWWVQSHGEGKMWEMALSSKEGGREGSCWLEQWQEVGMCLADSERFSKLERRKNRGEEMTSETTGTRASSQRLAALKKRKFMEVQNVVLKHIAFVRKAALSSRDPRELKEKRRRSWRKQAVKRDV